MEFLAYRTQNESCHYKQGEDWRAGSFSQPQPFTLLTAEAMFCSIFGITFVTVKKKKKENPPISFPRKSMCAKKEGGPGQGSHGGLRLPSTSVSTWYKTSARVCSTTAPQPISLICGRNEKQKGGDENNYSKKLPRCWGCMWTFLMLLTGRYVRSFGGYLKHGPKLMETWDKFNPSRHGKTK